MEEPEAHLYPDAQKKTMELLSLFMHNENSLLITTHSPYILGTINNLLFANQVYDKSDSEKKKQIAKIIDTNMHIKLCNAYFVKDGVAKDCIDKDDLLIINEVIDGASKEINDDYDDLFNLVTEE